MLPGGGGVAFRLGSSASRLLRRGQRGCLRGTFGVTGGGFCPILRGRRQAVFVADSLDAAG